MSSNIRLRILVCSANPTDAHEYVSDLRCVGAQEFLESIEAASLRYTDVAPLIAEQRINTLFVAPLADWNGLHTSGPFIDEVRRNFPEVRFVLYGDEAEFTRRESEIREHYPHLLQFFRLTSGTTNQSDFNARALTILERVRSNLEVEAGDKQFPKPPPSPVPPSPPNGGASDHPAWRLAVIALVLGVGLLGFWLLPPSGAIVWFIFALVVLPLASASVSHRGMDARDFRGMYRDGLNSLPLIGSLLRSSKSNDE